MILVCVFYHVIIKQANGIHSVMFSWGLIIGRDFHGKCTNNEKSVKNVATGLQTTTIRTYKY